MERTILHIDANAYYASVECLHHPELRGKPMAVGGDVEARHGIILSANQIARRCKVKTGEALWQAKQKCPELIVVPPHFDLYFRFTKLTRALYYEYAPQVEPFGLDEAWVEVTNTEKLGKLGARGLADEIRRRVKDELGITVSIGVSYSKIFAKLGSDFRKPDAVTMFNRSNIRELVWPLPCSDLLYIGRSTEKKLCKYGIRTIGQLAQTPPEYLHRWLGKWGLMLSAYANGLDNSPVADFGEQQVVKSIGNSITLPRDLCCDEDAAIAFWMLCESVASRLRAHGLLCRTVQISLRTNDLSSLERQKKLAQPTCLASALHEAAMELLRGNFIWQIPLRSIGVRAVDLLPAATPQQLSMFEDAEKAERLERLEHAVDGVRQRFGPRAIRRAVSMIDPTLMGIEIGDTHTASFNRAV